jgi:hypothetical protein
VPVVVTEQERISTGVTENRTEVEVCGQKTFTEVEDRPVVRERVERVMEHRPVEKQVSFVMHVHRNPSILCCMSTTSSAVSAA